MNEDQILKMESKENKIEKLELENKSLKMGIKALMIMFILVVIVSLFTVRESSSVFAMFWAFIAGEAYPKYKVTNKKSFLITTILGSIASICSFLNFTLSITL